MYPHKKTRSEFIAIITHFNMWFSLGWHDIKHRYRRSLIGPFWITISSGIMVGCIGLVFSAIFRTPVAEFLPYFATGQIMWLFISGQISDSCSTFIQHQSIIKQISVPLSVYIMRSLWNNLILLLHNLIIVAAILLFTRRGFSWEIIYALPALVLIITLLFLVSITLGIVCTRFRDIIQVVGVSLQLLYFLTPILWKKSVLPVEYSWITEINPFSNMIEIIRAPFLGHAPAAMLWVHLLAYIAGATVIALFFIRNYRHRVAYWL